MHTEKLCIFSHLSMGEIKMRKIAAISIAMICALIQQASAVSLVLDGDGNLLGASNVVVDGRNFDVSFEGGTCVDLYAGCTGSPFDFMDEALALEAAQALLDQVFLDGPDGLFDTADFDSINGCVFDGNCLTRIPFGTVGIDGYLSATIFNVSGDDSVLSEGPFAADNGPFTNVNFAFFTEVPLPGAFVLFLSVFLAPIAARFKA